MIDIRLIFDCDNVKNVTDGNLHDKSLKSVERPPAIIHKPISPISLFSKLIFFIFPLEFNNFDIITALFLFILLSLKITVSNSVNFPAILQSNSKPSKVN